MTRRPTLTVVGSDKPDTAAADMEMVNRAKDRMLDAVKADGCYWLVTAIGEEVSVSYFGGKLESAVLAEAMAEAMKREAVGL